MRWSHAVLVNIDDINAHVRRNYIRSLTTLVNRTIINSYFMASSAAEVAKRSALGGAIFLNLMPYNIHIIYVNYVVTQ